MKRLNIKQSKKYLVGILVLLVLVGMGVIWQGKKFEIRFDERGVALAPEKMWYESQQQYMEKLVDWQEELLERQSQDNFGGATPEETLNAFIEALKQGNTELASRYFVFNKQEQMAKELAIGKENGNLGLLIGDLEKEKESYEISKDYFRYRTFDGEGLAEFSFDLKFNEDTQVWKMESL